MEKTGDTPKWVEYIHSRIERAKHWREEMQSHQKLAEEYRYVRILGKSFRAISISPENPCGRLIKNDDGKPVEGRPNIRAAIQSAYNALPYGHPGDYKPSRHKAVDPDTDAKPEHRIQAFLIRHALMNGQKLHGLIKGFEDAFDELLFVTDELAAGALRADVIAMGRKGDCYFPVFIELKVDRQLKCLEGQLAGARDLMNLAGDPFIAMLSAATGVPTAKISFNGHRLMAIWSSTTSGVEDKRVEIARSEGYLFAEYAKQGSGYAFTRN